MLDFEQIKSLAGWLTKNEALFLFENAKKVAAKNAIVEIGSWKGRSTTCLCIGSQYGKNAKVYAIDPHVGSSEHQRQFGKVDTFEDFLKNIHSYGVAEVVEPIRDSSLNVAKVFDKQVGFIFIDGAHEYEAVKNDFESWFPKLSNGGVVAFHDAWWFGGVRFLTYLLLMTSNNVKNPKAADTIISFEKAPHNHFIDRFYNALFIPYHFFISGFWGSIKMYLFGIAKSPQ